MATHSSIRARRIPNGQRNPWGLKELDMTKQLSTHGTANKWMTCQRKVRLYLWESYGGSQVGACSFLL